MPSVGTESSSRTAERGIVRLMSKRRDRRKGRGTNEGAGRLCGLVKSEQGFGLVEALIAAVILAIGLLAIAGLSVSTAGQGNVARWQTDQAIVAQSVLEEAHRRGFDGLTADWERSISVGGREYAVAATVTKLSARVKEVTASVSGVGPLRERTFTTRVYAPRQLPAPGGS